MSPGSRHTKSISKINSKFMTVLGTISLLCLVVAPAKISVADRDPDENQVFSTKPVDPKQSKKILSDAVSSLKIFSKQEGFCDRMKSAVAMMVFPNVMRFGFVIVLTEGVGVFVRRLDNQDLWSKPMFVGFTSVSVGPQLAMQEESHLLLYRAGPSSQSVVPRATSYDGNFGMALWDIDATIFNASPQPVGRGYTYSINDGLFVGASVTIGDIDSREDWNSAFYGEQTSSDSKSQPFNSPDTEGLGARVASMAAEKCQ